MAHLPVIREERTRPICCTRTEVIVQVFAFCNRIRLPLLDEKLVMLICFGTSQPSVFDLRPVAEGQGDFGGQMIHDL
jgi:hypothetical protein